MNPIRPPRHNLPRELSGFVGRERETAEVARRLGATCHLTLTGAGGIGKTRLALRVAHDLAAGGVYADGVWLVELASLGAPDLAPRLVASVLGAPEQPGRSPADALVAALAPRELLLVLDNCEHAIEACAELVARLLTDCPRLRVLATSREALGVPGEVAWSVPPLGLPDDRAARTLTGIAAAEAVRLFVERAAAALPPFALTADNAPAVAEICRRLDGIPLAIELAAARVALLTPAEIVGRLDDALGLLTTGQRAAPERQRTLEAAIGWSYDLLDQPERTLFGRLAAFAGGFSLDAAEAVCAGRGVAESAVLDLLGRLVARSLVLAQSDGDATRYRLLEPVRQFARQRLVERGELAETDRRHAAYFVALAERAAPALHGPEQARWFRALDAESDNLRSAHAWASAEGDPDVALRLAGALWWWWARPDRQAEGRAHLAAAVALPGGTGDAGRRARVLVGLAMLSLMQSDLPAAAGLARDGLALAEAAGDRSVVARALGALGMLDLFRGQAAAARARLEPALELARAVGDRFVEAWALQCLANVALQEGDPGGAVERLEESVRVGRAAGDGWSVAMALNGLGDAARSRGDGPAARAAYEEALPLFQRIGAPAAYPGILHNLGYVALSAGEPARAVELFLESAELYRSGGADRRGVAECLMGLADAAVRSGQAELAAGLFGAAEAALEALGSTFTPANRGDYERGLASLRAALDADRLAAAWSDGRSWSLDEALALGRGRLEPGPSPGVDGTAARSGGSRPAGRASAGWPASQLTAREREVARLVAGGLTNRQIAETLVITEKTAANHVQRVMDKLEIHSRTRLAVRAVELGLLGDDAGDGGANGRA
jgi:predicted ATPase/DNA-binding CsgD family transcriptional regulator/Tfp pilus assembly protein PilF